MAPPVWYVALLRGINVGGNNPVPMAALRECLAGLGARNVATYIQSGNVLFEGGEHDESRWTRKIEAGLSDRFGFAARIAVRSHPDLRAVVDGAPPGFGEHPDTFRSDVVFLLGPAGAAEIVAGLRPRDGVDTVVAGDRVVYFERLIARASQSYLTRVIGLPVYRQMTIRNWRTTTTLLAMLDERARDAAGGTV
jgi:uncharacterized protein (DUF1697 family)